MLYSVDKLKKLLISKGDFCYVRLSSQNSDVAIRLTNNGSSVVPDGSLFPGAYVVCMNQPMTAPVLKRVLGKRGGIKVLLADGTEQVFIRATSRSCQAKSGVTFSLTDPVWYCSDTNKKALLELSKRAEAKRQWLLKGGGLAESCTYGFELETQDTMGYTPKTVGEAPFNPANLPLDSHVIRDYIPDSRIGRSIAALNPEAFQNIIDILGIHNVCSSLPYKYFLPFSDGLEISTDGSVDGFEIKTVGGLTEAEFALRVADLYKVSHKIDHRCSFHIHVGSDKLELPTTANQIGAMTDYILKHPLLPETVKARLNNIKSNYFCRVNIKSPFSKNSFIRVHPQGTLEFRCFGNIQNSDQALICRRIAEEAVIEGLTTTKSFSSAWADDLADKMKKGINICA